MKCFQSNKIAHNRDAGICMLEKLKITILSLKRKWKKNKRQTRTTEQPRNQKKIKARQKQKQQNQPTTQKKKKTIKKDRPYDVIDYNKLKDFVISVMRFSQERRVKTQEN